MSTQRLSGAERKKLIELRDEAYDEQGGLCYYCNKPMANPKSQGETTNPMRCSAEHLNQVRNGGKARKGNIVAAHQRCNQEREEL